jgi:hypothetical protein
MTILAFLHLLEENGKINDYSPTRVWLIRTISIQDSCLLPLANSILLLVCVVGYWRSLVASTRWIGLGGDHWEN